MEHLGTRDRARTGFLCNRLLVPGRRRVKNRPADTLEFNLNPRMHIRTAQVDVSTLRVIRVGAHDNASIHAQAVQHEGHEHGVLLIVTDHLLAFEHASQTVRAATRAGLGIIGVLVEALFLQVTFDRASFCKVSLLGSRLLGCELTNFVRDTGVSTGIGHGVSSGKLTIRPDRNDHRLRGVLHVPALDILRGRQRGISPRIVVKTVLKSRRLRGSLSTRGGSVLVEDHGRGGSHDGDPRPQKLRGLQGHLGC